MAQEKEKPGVAGGGCLPPHGIATSQFFHWRVLFGLTARKTPQLAKVILADGAVNHVPALLHVAGSEAATRRDGDYQDGDRAQPA